ncbi:DoxX family protein [Corynebacterium sp.]|uniref:DoxX family protein n=1 Tax=Corynebacterium sp. TaxID=1720 RepID=UPI003736AF9A
MSDKLPRDNDRKTQPEYVDEIDDLDVPSYDAQNPTTSIYDRTGRAAPERIDPADAHTTQFDAHTTQFERPAEPAPSTALSSEPLLSEPVATGTPAAYEEEEVVVDTRVDDARRGTTDLGLLLLRILVGGFLILTSVATFFRLGGNEGLAGLERDFSAYAYGDILAIALPTAQLAAGVFLLLGLITPVAAMVATVATGFMALHAIASEGGGLNVFAWPESVWLGIILLGLSVVLQFTGPGLYSFDTGRSWARRPLASSWIFIVLGIVALIAVWIFGTGFNPVA